MLKVLISLPFFLFIYFFSFSSAIAASNFTTDYNVTYTVLENALTNVRFDISLTNKTTQYYASSYSLQVGFRDINNVSVNDRRGKINPVVRKNKDGSNIDVVFNERVVGLNKKLNFSISFDTKDIAQKSGKIWDINIPGLAKQKEYNIFNVKVIVPQSLGNPSYVKPDIGTFNNNVLSFNKKELGESGISISYGREEVYNFNLSYHLKNSNLFPIKTEIALPPTTNYQDVEIVDIDPKPQNVIKDKDGNWLAQYLLGPSKKLDVKVKGKAKIMLHPKKEELPKEQLEEYLKEHQFWQTKNKDIIKLATELKTPYAIYQYVVKNLTYDFSRVESGKPRLGAAEVLKNPNSAVCLEFTDLFIALARAAGIPAREVNGFAFTQNSKERPLSLVKDVLHAWPEYYDFELKTWVMVDPTWENTTGGVDYFYTLDFDHFTFVRKGISSTYPMPAGGYKIENNKSSKDINIEFGDNFEPPNQKLTFSENFSSNFFSGASVRGNVTIRNTGTIISTPQSILVSTNFLTPLTQEVNFGEIPPYGFLTVPVSFERTSILTNESDIIKIAIEEKYISKNINISPFILNGWIIIGGIIFVSIIITIPIIANRSRNLPFLK